MKQRCLFISLLALMASVFQLMPVQAQNQFAIYNYRNDGDFNAWLDSDVEKITYSNTDLDGVEHENIVVQEVWTSDSIYRIPLETVDSIAFNAPKPVMREGVFYLRGYHGSHTLQIDSLTIYFDTAISRDSLPSVGQTVLSQSPTYPYDGGFAGKAVDISFSGQYVKVVCCRAEIADIFKRLVLVGKAVSEDDSSPAHSKALARKMSGLDDMDIKTFTLGDINFSALNGIASMKSKKPKAVCSYYVYIDELFYKISANVNLIHHDISYTVKINNEILQRLDTETYSLLYELMNNDLLEDEEREELEESLLEEEWKKKIRLFEVPVGPVVIYLEGALSCKIGGKLEASYTYSTHVNQYMSFEASGPTIALLNPYSATLGALGSIKSLDSRFDEDESYANEKFSLKLDGSVSLGGSLQLGACLWSDKVLHICAGGEGGLKLNATLDINLDTADFDTEEDDVYNYPVWYGLTKDTKATAELYAKVKGEIGITPSKFLTLKGDYQPKSWKKELGTVYLFPHFTKPMLPQVYQMGQWEYSPLSLRSIPSNNLLFSSKLGMVITDSEKKQLYYTPQNQEYVNEEEWIEENDAMTVSVANLEPGSYYCYPAFCLWGDKLWKAGPYTKFEVPKPIEVSSENVTVGVGSQKAIPFTGGWGNYSVAVQDKSVCTAELKQEGDSYYIQIVGNKVGTATIKLTDERSKKEVTLNVSVIRASSLTLAKNSVELSVGGKESVKILSGSESYEVTTDNPSVVSVSLSTISISGGGRTEEQSTTHTVFDAVIEALSVGKAVVTVKDLSSGEIAKINVTVSGDIVAYTSCPDAHHPHLIDLGLPSGTKWACCNVGAEKPEDYGGYFAWGETAEKTRYYWDTYTHCDGSSSTCHDIGKDIAGTQYDAATVNWGSPWVMPNLEQMEELKNSSTSEWTTENGVNGRRFTGPNGASIFLPASGRRWNDALSNAGSYGIYWSSTLYESNTDDAYELYFGSGGVYTIHDVDRSRGQSVRPVRKN